MFVTTGKFHLQTLIFLVLEVGGSRCLCGKNYFYRQQTKLQEVGLSLVTGCSQYQIEQCLNAFVSEVGTEPAKTEQEVISICDSHFPTLKSCLSAHTGGCNFEVRSLFEVVTKTFDYTCHEGREDAIKYAECLSKSSLVSETKQCETTMKSKIQRTRDRETQCGYIDDYLDCATDATKAECGAGAAEYQKKVVQFSEGTLLESIGCGCASISAMMWIVAAALILQWFVR